MKLALTFLLAFVGNGTLALGRFTSVERLAGFSLRRKFFQERR